MMKTKLKFFLVFLAVLVGELNGVWAESIGSLDAEYGAVSTNWITIPHGSKLHYEFVNHSKMDNNNNNWLLKISGTTGQDFILQADAWWICGDNNPDNNNLGTKVVSFTNDYSWDTFKNDMDGAKVSIDITLSGWFIIVRASATNNGRTYNETLKLYNNPENEIKACLSVFQAYLEISQSKLTVVESTFYDFSSGSLDSRFEGEDANGGHWTFMKGGYCNYQSGSRNFTIKNLLNGDQVVVTFTGADGELQTANLKTNGGELLVVGSTFSSEDSYYVTEDGNLTIKFPRNAVILNVEITHEIESKVENVITEISAPTIEFVVKSHTMTVGQTFQTEVSTKPTMATPEYTTNSPSVATVDQYGRITAQGVGTATITATLTTINNQSASDNCVITVNSVTSQTLGYDFQRSDVSGNVEEPTNGTVTIDGENYTRLASGSYIYTGPTPEPDNVFFAVSGTVSTTNGWYRRESGSTRGLFNGTNSTQNLYIKLQNGDKIKIVYEGFGLTNPVVVASANLQAIEAGVYNDVSAGTPLVNDGEYNITEDGYLVLKIRANAYIKTIQIQREGSPALSFVPSSISYELTDLNFTEPALIKQPAGVGVTYESLDETIAMVPNEKVHDVMFVKPGIVKIRATAVVNNQSYTAEYTVTVKAGDAITVTQNNRCYFPEDNPYSGRANTGVLAIDATTVKSVPFMTMQFGNGDNTVLVRDFSNVKSSMIIDDEGWQNMSYTVDVNQRVLPTKGTYYVFRPALDGELLIEGVRRVENNVARTNSVVLVNASDNVSTSNIINTVDKKAHYNLIAGSDPIAAGTTVDIPNDADNSDIVAVLTYGVSGGAAFGSPVSDSHVSGYTAYTEGNGENGSANGGTVYTIRPNYSGEIEVAVVLNVGKNFYILEDGIPLDNYNGITVQDKTYGTYKFPVTKNKTYKVYCTGSKLGFYGLTFTPIKSYPVVKELEFDSNNAALTNDNQKISLTGGNTYYLYGNTASTNGGDYQVFYLHGFTYTTNFGFEYKGVVMDGDVTGNIKNDNYKHIAVNKSEYTLESAGSLTGISYTVVYKNKDKTEESVTITDGKISNLKEGSYVVTASVGGVKDYYVLTVPYTIEQAPQNRISWKFNKIGVTRQMETREQLNANADEWKVYYKVRLYDKQTRALTYINVPVRANGIPVAGDNARYLDNTAGLLFKGNAHDFGTTAKDFDNTATLAQKLQANPTSLEDNDYVTMFNGTSMTIPNLKAGQYVRVKWSRYSDTNGDRIRCTNVTDLENRNMDNQSISVGAGGRVSDNGGTGYHEFKVKTDGDVTFTVDQDGWVNIYEVDVANVFIPTDLRLQTVDASASGGSRGSALAFIHKKDHGDNIVEEYSTAYGRILSQSNTTMTYHIKGDASGETDTRTGTLNSTNCTIGGDNKTLTVRGGNTSGNTGGHGRFTLVQEGKVDDTYLLDRNEYEIKVYEYDYSYKQHPYTWNMENISTGTGTSLSADKNQTNNCWSQTSGQASAYQYQLTLEPENMLAWEYRNGSGVETAVRELDGLGIRPNDITKTDNTIVFSTNNGGVDLSGTAPQILTIPAVAVGETAYIRLEEKTEPNVSVKYADGTDATPVATSLGGSYKTYKVAGNGKDIEFNLNNVSVKQVAVSKDTKTITAAGYATEARSYNLDFDLNETFGGSADALTAKKVTGVAGSQIVLGNEATPYFPAMTFISDETNLVKEGKYVEGVNGWQGASGVADWAAPLIDTYDGRTEIKMAEKFGYNEAVNETGNILWQTVSGLENSNYYVELYANAMTTADRTSDGISSDLVDGAMDVAYVFANNSEVPIVARRATSTTKNGEYSLVTEVTDGTLTLGLGKKKAGTNWNTIQIKRLAKVQMQGVLLQGTSGDYPLFTWDVNRTTSDMTDNKLIGVSEVIVGTPVLPQKDANGNYNYILANGGALIKYDFNDDNENIDNTTGTQTGEVSGLGFYLVIKDGTYLSDGVYYAERPNPHSAYLQLSGAYLRQHAPIPENVNGIRQFFFLDTEVDATSVESVSKPFMDVPMNDDAYYSLQGVRVENPAKGLYIRGGKKVVIK